MSKIILFGFTTVLVGIFLFSVPTASAAEASASQTNMPLTSEEIVILQQSLTALTAVLTELQVTLAKNNNELPQNTAQIIESLSNIGKSLAQISETIKSRGLAAVASAPMIVQPPLITIQKSSESAVKASEEVAVPKMELAESEGQLETLLGGSAAGATVEKKTLMASISAIAKQKITWVVVVLLIIGVVLFWKMRGGEATAKA